MEKIAPIKLADGRLIMVEMEQGDLALPGSGAAPTDLPAGAEATGLSDNISSAIGLLRNQISAVADTVQEALVSNRPDELKVELTIGFKGESQPIPVILTGAASGGLKITASWKR